MRVLKFAEHRSGQMRGFLSIQLGSGLIIHDCRLMVPENGDYWIALPSRPVLDENRCQATNEGKPIYAPSVEFASRDVSDRFQAQPLEELRASHRELFRGDGVR